VWIYDVDSFRQLTFEGEVNHSPVWTPDGQWITFSLTLKGAGKFGHSFTTREKGRDPESLQLIETLHSSLMTRAHDSPG